MKEKNTKIGILKYIASTGARGVKFVDQPETWYNPANDEAKAMVNDNFKGKQVEIVLADGKKTEFVSMVLLDAKNEEKPVVTEEYIETEEEKPKLVKPKVTTTESLQHEEVITEADKVENLEIESIATDNFIYALTAGIENYTKEDYSEMEQTKLETESKGPNKLTYASWAEVWGALKRIHPTAQFYVHENKEQMPLFFNKELPSMGAFVKVTVKVKGLEHTVHLPVMNNYNKSMKLNEITTFDVNKSIQRALAKAIALHGMGLYIFKGEDYPTDDK